MYLPRFQYLAPAGEAELASMLAEHGDKARILAGGTDLLVQMKAPGLWPDYLIDIRNVAELSSIEFDDQDGLTVGASAKLENILNTPAVAERYHGLYQAIETIGARQILTMGSMGGNICNASPAADSPPALMSFNAQVTIGSTQGDKEMALEDFIQGNRKTALEVGEYLKSIFLPAPAAKSGSAYHYFRVRGGMEIAMVAAAVYVEADLADKSLKDIKIVLGVVGPTPIRALEAEDMLTGQTPDEDLLAKALGSCAAVSKPIDDFRASAEYRREILKVLVQRAFGEAYTIAIS